MPCLNQNMGTKRLLHFLCSMKCFLIPKRNWIMLLWIYTREEVFPWICHAAIAKPSNRLHIPHPNLMLHVLCYSLWFRHYLLYWYDTTCLTYSHNMASKLICIHYTAFLYQIMLMYSFDSTVNRLTFYNKEYSRDKVLSFTHLQIHPQALPHILILYPCISAFGILIYYILDETQNFI